MGPWPGMDPDLRQSLKTSSGIKTMLCLKTGQHDLVLSGYQDTDKLRVNVRNVLVGPVGLFIIITNPPITF